MRTWRSACSLAVIVGMGVCGCGEDKPKTNNPPPTELRKLGVLTSAGQNGHWDGFAIHGQHLYLAQDSIHIYDVRNGSDAAEVGVFDARGATGLIVRGDRLFYSDEGGLHVADISNPTSIRPLSVIEDPEFGPHALRAIRSAPAQVVVPSTGVGPRNEVILYDLIHPEKPEQVARFLAGNEVTSLAIDGSTLYVATDLPPDGFVEVWDVSNWDAPTRLGIARGRCGLLFVAGDGAVLCGQGGVGPDANRTKGLGGVPLPNPALDARDRAHPAFVVVDQEQWFGVSAFERVGSYVYAKTFPKPAAPEGRFLAYDIRDPLHPRFRPFAVTAPLRELGGADDTTEALTSDARFIYAQHPSGLTIYARQTVSDE